MPLMPNPVTMYGSQLDEASHFVGGPERRMNVPCTYYPGFVRVETDNEYRQRIMSVMGFPDAVDFTAKVMVGAVPQDPTITKACPTPDEWIKVGTTTIDGTFEQVREVFEATWENFDHMRYATASGDVWDIGGRSLMIVDRMEVDEGVLVHCDIVRRKSKIDAERSAALLEDATRDFLGAMEKAHDRIAASRPPCPECGPHGNRGKVFLLETMVDCGTCRPIELVPEAALAEGRRALASSPCDACGDTGMTDDWQVCPCSPRGVALSPPRRRFYWMTDLQGDDVVFGMPREVLFGHLPGALEGSAEHENLRRYRAMTSSASAPAAMRPCDDFEWGCRCDQCKRYILS